MPQTTSSTLALPRVAAIVVSGARISDDAMDSLIEARIEQAIRVANRAVLRFTDQDFKLIDGTVFEINKEIKVAFSDENATQTDVFKGEITSIAVEQTTREGHELVIEALDLSHRLGHGSKTKTFVQQTYTQAVSQIAREMGLTAQLDHTLNTPTHPYLVCTGTYAAFLDEIALKTGTEWFVDGTTLHVRRRVAKPATTVLKFGDKLVRFKARFSGSDRVSEVQVRSWDPSAKQAVVGTAAVLNSGVEGSNAPGGASSMRSKAASVSGTSALINGNLAAVSSDEARVVAEGLRNRRGTTDLIARGEVLGTPALKAGTYVDVQNVGTRMSGTYYLTSVEHIFGRSGDLVTRFTAGPIESASIVDLLGDQNGALGSWASNGPVIGLVTNNKDPDGMHRVKVKFPTLSDQAESNWARMVTLGAGANRGFVVMPQINDEVLVVFEHGDLRRPLVIGSLWNGRDKPPAPAIDNLLAQSKVIQWGLTSNAGHTFTIRDGQDEKNIELKLIDGVTKLLLDDKKVELHGNGQTLELKCGEASIKLEKSGAITISGTTITVDAKQSVDVKAQTAINVKATVAAKIEGTSVDIKANGSVNVQGSGPLILKGNPAMIN
jgi:phage protein D